MSDNNITHQQEEQFLIFPSTEVATTGDDGEILLVDESVFYPDYSRAIQYTHTDPEDMDGSIRLSAFLGLTFTIVGLCVRNGDNHLSLPSMVFFTLAFFYVGRNLFLKNKKKKLKESFDIITKRMSQPDTVENMVILGNEKDFSAIKFTSNITSAYPKFHRSLGLPESPTATSLFAFSLSLALSAPGIHHTAKKITLDMLRSTQEQRAKYVNKIVEITGYGLGMIHIPQK